MQREDRVGNGRSRATAGLSATLRDYVILYDVVTDDLKVPSFAVANDTDPFKVRL